MRILATIAVQPYVKKKLAPKDLLPFPWEKAPKRKAVSLQEDKERLEELLKKIKGTGVNQICRGKDTQEDQTGRLHRRFQQ